MGSEAEGCLEIAAARQLLTGDFSSKKSKKGSAKISRNRRAVYLMFWNFLPGQKRMLGFLFMSLMRQEKETVLAMQRASLQSKRHFFVGISMESKLSLLKMSLQLPLFQSAEFNFIEGAGRGKLE